ncbi:MAG: ABC transporter substrate-binding protein [Desulfobaccales bacterium]
MPSIRSVMGTLAVWLLMAWAVPAWAGPATDAVKSVVDEVIRILNDPALATQKERRRQLVKAKVDQRFDYEEMAKRSLGPTWGRLSPAQRSEFVRLFGELLEASYSDKIDKYAGETVTFLGESLDGDYAEVRTLLVRPNDKIPMNYRLINKSRWVIYDVVIEGVSLVSNYRSQFSQIISQSSYQELVHRLRTRVEELRRAQRGA